MHIIVFIMAVSICKKPLAGFPRRGGMVSMHSLQSLGVFEGGVVFVFVFVFGVFVLGFYVT